MTETEDILCAPLVLEDGWAQFLVERIGLRKGADSKLPGLRHVVWVRPDTENAPCPDCGEVYRLHESSSHAFTATHPQIGRGSTNDRFNHLLVCHCYGRFVE